MKSLRLAKYVFSSVLRSLWRSRWLHISSAGTIAVTFLVFGGAFLFSKNLHTSLVQAKGTSHLSVYLKEGKEDATKKEIVENYCAPHPSLRCEFRSREDALREFKRSNPELASIPASLAVNPFPASVEIELDPTFRDAEVLTKYTRDLSRVDGVDVVDEGGNWLHQWLGFLELMDSLIKVIGLILGLSLTVVVSNTIALVVYARRDEVEILDLIGASSLLLRMPFVLEGMIQGLVGIGISLALMDALLLGVSPILHGMDETLLLLFQPFTLTEHFLLMASGALIGMLGSMFAVRRYKTA